MARFTNSLFEKQTIYEIFRACRLCGAGGGYKMPIIQNVVDLDDSDVELKEKIRDCVQIEVNTDDKMPPLICELCVDKINDFYEFLEMCRQTNKRTRLRLGLPPQLMPKGVPDAEDCILGITEPIFRNDDSDEDKPLVKKLDHGKHSLKPDKTNRHNSKKGKDSKITKISSKISLSSLSTKSSLKTKRSRSPSPSPPPTKRVTRNMQDDEPRTLRLSTNDSSRNRRSSTSSSISETSSKMSAKHRKKEDKLEFEESIYPSRSNKKRPLEKEREHAKPTPASKPGPASKKLKVVSPPKLPPAPQFECSVCQMSLKSHQALSAHVRGHVPLFTAPKLACNACRDWFPTPEDAQAHHKQHRAAGKPYRCATCRATFKLYQGYTDHQRECFPYVEVDDQKCDECWRVYPTRLLLEQHKCLGEDGRPGGKCSKCRRVYTLLRNLKKHELTCTHIRKGEVKIDPDVRRRLRLMEIRVSRCDPLLRRKVTGDDLAEHYDVSRVNTLYGLDKSCVYPYQATARVKLEPHDAMVSINTDILDYEQWDSDNDGTDSSEDTTNAPVPTFDDSKPKKVESLSKLALKVLKNSQKRKKRRKRKKDFDSILTVSFTDKDIKRDINSIIDNLDKSWDDAFDSFVEKSDDSAKKQEDSVSLSLIDDDDKVDAANQQIAEESVKVEKVQEFSGVQAAADDSTDDELDVPNVLDKKIADEKIETESGIRDGGADSKREDAKTIGDVGDKDEALLKEIGDDIKENQSEKLNELTQETFKHPAEVREEKSEENIIEESQTFTQNADEYTSNFETTEKDFTEEKLSENTNIMEKSETSQNINQLTRNAEEIDKNNPVLNEADVDDKNYNESQTFTQYLDDEESDEKEGRSEEIGAPAEVIGERSEDDHIEGTMSESDIEKKDETQESLNSETDNTKEFADKPERSDNERKIENNALHFENNLTSINADIAQAVTSENSINKLETQENGVTTNPNPMKRVSEHEMYDKELMDALDEQIGEINNVKTDENPEFHKATDEKQDVSDSAVKKSDVIEKQKDKSMDLDNISDDEFDFDS